MRRMIGLLSLLVWILPTWPLLAEGIEVLDPWIRERPPSMQALEAYMVILNTGLESKMVVAASSPLFAKVEIHKTLYRGNTGTMLSTNGLIINARAQTYLKPGGYHLMLIAPQGPRPLRAGDRVPLLLGFSDGSHVLIKAEVRRLQSGSIGSRR